MATPAQIDANRRNAMHSTGPRTPEGKQNSSRNNLRHGLCAEKHFLDAEDADGFDALLQDLRARLRPVGALEDALVMRIAAAHWRLARALPMENQILRSRIAQLPGLSEDDRAHPTEHLGAAFLNDCANSQGLVKLSRYETTLERSIRNCLRQLEAFQRSRAAACRLQSPAAERTQSAAAAGIPISDFVRHPPAQPLPGDPFPLRETLGAAPLLPHPPARAADYGSPRAL